MYETLFLGNEKINLEKVDSTNTYLKRLVATNKKCMEGIVVTAKNQYSGRGQRGSYWQSEPSQNLTFSLLLKPNIAVVDQFMLSKVISLGIRDFLIYKEIKHVTIKWPNDIYVEDNKIAGILIENVLKGNRVEAAIVGVGLNVNQTTFGGDVINATSLKQIQSKEFYLHEMLQQLLFAIEKRYLMLKNLNFFDLNRDYVKYLFQLNKTSQYEVNHHIVQGEIVDVSKSGKLQININGVVKEFDLKEVKFVMQ